MRCVQIDTQSGVVGTSVLWGEDGLPPNGEGYSWLASDDAQPGWVLVNGVLAAPAPAVASKDDLKAAVMAKRDAVIDGGFTFANVAYQSGPTDRENIAGAAQLAFMAIVAGAQAGNLRWADPNADFGWIATDNTVVPMDAPTVVAFAKAVAGFKSACIFYARSLKDQIEAAADPSTVEISAGWPNS